MSASVERFVATTRTALAALLGGGGVAAGSQTIAAWRSLGAQARGLGLTELGALAERLSTQLQNRGAFAHTPSQALADTTLEIFDRIEALASTLALWAVEQAFEPRQEGQSS